MPGRPSLFDPGCRNGAVCLLNFLRPAAAASRVQPLAARHISQTAKRKARTRAGSQPRPPTRTTPATTGSAFRKPTQAELLRDIAGEDVEDERELGESQNFSARFFEQEGHKLTEIPDDGSYEHGLAGIDPSALKASFEYMKRVVSSKEEREALEDVLGSLGSSWENMRTKDDIKSVMKRIKEQGASIDAEMDEALDELPEELREGVAERLGPLLGRSKYKVPAPSRPPTPQIPLQPYTGTQRRKISRLNSVIERTMREMRLPDGLAEKHVSALYRSYSAARMSLASSWGSVPLDAWDLLWNVFAADESINPHRLGHVSQLARDMSDAKVPLSPAQQLLTIEAVFVDGWEQKALENWKRCIPSLGIESSETFKDFWELGVRMNCRMGDMERAERAVTKLLDNNSDPRILIPIIRTLSERGTPEDHEKAWLSYRQMRELLGRNMKLSDYDQIVALFLVTNQTENALYAFVDMMSDGQINLKKLKYLPSSVANKFFVGKWLKRLIGSGDLDGAHSVIRFMRDRGVEAAPIHLNGLIGAWQRSAGADNMDKADKLAWEMIQARVDFVSARRAESSGLAAQATDASRSPRATLETFSLLAENYRLRDMHDRMVQLWDAFTDAELSPNAFMINQLLESYIGAHKVKEAKALYKTLITERGIEPDPYTFSALWKTLDINRLHHVPNEALRVESQEARRLFAEAARFRSVFGPRGMDGQLARKILHTFRRIQDKAGFLVALTALKELFNFLPTETLVMEMVLDTTRLSWSSPNQRRRLMAAKRELDSHLPPRAGSDATRLQDGGGDTHHGVALYEYLQKRFWPTAEPEDTRAAFLEAARDMGVQDALASLGRSS